MGRPRMIWENSIRETRKIDNLTAKITIDRERWKGAELFFCLEVTRCLVKNSKEEEDIL